MRTNVAPLLLLLAPSVSLAADAARFRDYQNYIVGSVITLTMADVNHDGIPDVVAATGSGVAVLLGHADGSLTASASLPTGLSTSVVVADFNNDGHPDIALVGSPTGNGNYIELALGNGDGTFQTPTILPISCINYSCELAAADFNGDGNQDLAISFTGWVTVYLGSGNGTFTGGLPIYAMRYAVYLATADLNQDGKPDLVVSDQIADELVVLLGNGDGSFQRTNYANGYSPYGLVLADFNGDGLPDVAIADGPAALVGVRLNQGGGVLGRVVTYPTACNHCNLQSIAAGVFNPEGKTDLATPASILRGNGDGTFQAPINFAAGLGPDQVASGDFNRDGYSDLVVGNEEEVASLSVLLGDANGVQQPPSLAVGGSPWALATADFNGDKKTDLAVAAEGSNEVQVFLGQGYGRFTQSAALSVYEVGAVVAADFNGDGKIDIAASGENGTSIFLGNGDGTFTAGAQYTGFYGSCTMDFWPSHPCFAAADFNNDGIPDLAGALWIQNEIFFLLGNGDGTFRPGPTIFVGDAPQGLAVGDFNHDGNLDVAVSGYGGMITVYPGNGDGTFGTPVVLTLPFGGLAGIAVGDVNGDGNLDIVVAGGSVSAGIYIFTGNGDLTFNPPVSLATDEIPNWVVLADLSDSGRLDIASANVGANDVTVLVNQGNLSFSAGTLYGAGASPAMLVSAYLGNGQVTPNGQLDLISVNEDSGNLTILTHARK
jgi:hypothetical protein